MPLKDSYVKKLVYASLFAALTAAAAWVTIPLPYVPLTLQTFFVILAGALLGAYFGVLSMIVYLLLGFVGLPVFSGGRSGSRRAGRLHGWISGRLYRVCDRRRVFSGAKKEPGLSMVLHVHGGRHAGIIRLRGRLACGHHALGHRAGPDRRRTAFPAGGRHKDHRSRFHREKSEQGGLRLIELRHVSYSYGRRPAIRDISLSIGTGEMVSIIGPNASGKSTLARLINGLILPDEGDCIVDGMSTKEDVYTARKSGRNGIPGSR